jgi:CBS domain-containing protein
MTREIWTVGSEDTIDKVEHLFALHNLSAAPVVDEAGSLFGIISSYDLLHFTATRRNPRATRAWELCTYKPVAVNPDTPISHVARIMLTNKMHHVLIVEDGQLKGIVSTIDFVRQCLTNPAEFEHTQGQEPATQL